MLFFRRIEFRRFLIAFNICKRIAAFECEFLEAFVVSTICGLGRFGRFDFDRHFRFFLAGKSDSSRASASSFSSMSICCR